MNASKLIGLLPETLFAQSVAETRVDHQVKKLSGEVMFKLILFSILGSERLSLRVMESFLSSATFPHFAGTASLPSKYNSIRERICPIKAAYFAKLFRHTFTFCNEQLGEQKALSKADSTLCDVERQTVKGGPAKLTADREAARQIQRHATRLAAGFGEGLHHPALHFRKERERFAWSR